MCIVFPTKPNSKPGDIFLINLKSDVPPVVDNFGFNLVIFLIIFSILGLFLFIALMGITRNINKIKNQLESANEKIESFKDSMSTINKSVDIVKSVFGYSKKTK